MTRALCSDPDPSIRRTISGNKLEWVIEIDAGGQFIEIAMDGTVDGDELTGTADFGGYGGGDWTAKRM